MPQAWVLRLRAAMNELIIRWQRPFLSFAYRYVQGRDDARDLVEEGFLLEADVPRVLARAAAAWDWVMAGGNPQ